MSEVLKRLKELRTRLGNEYVWNFKPGADRGVIDVTVEDRDDLLYLLDSKIAEKEEESKHKETMTNGNAHRYEPIDLNALFGQIHRALILDTKPVPQNCQCAVFHYVTNATAYL